MARLRELEAEEARGERVSGVVYSEPAPGEGTKGLEGKDGSSRTVRTPDASGAREFHETPIRHADKTDKRCIHETTPDECAACSGYAKWLIADEGRLRRARSDPEGVRREFRGERERKLAKDALLRDALRYLDARHVDGADLSLLDPWEERVNEAYEAEPPEAFREAIRGFVRAGRAAFRAKGRGAA